MHYQRRMQQEVNFYNNKFYNFMICYQNKSKPSLNDLTHQSMKQSSKNNFLQKQNNLIKTKKKESTGCFCFSFSKKNQPQENKIDDSRIQPDESVKDQALRMSQQIALKSFKNIPKLKSSTKIQKDISNKKVIKTESDNIYLTKLKSPQPKETSFEKKQSKQKKTEQFNMNRLTFSAVNKSYQKTVNTTTNTTLNQSLSIDNSNILGSLVSLRREKQKSEQQSFSLSDQVSSVKSIVQKYKPVSSVRQISVKKLNILKTTSQFEPIKQENEQSQMKMHKIIKITGKKSQINETIVKKQQDPDFIQNEGPIYKIQTQQQLVSSSEEIDRVRYEYSSIVIDYFNPTPTMIEKIQTKTQLVGEQKRKITQNILPPQQQIQREKQPLSNQISQSSMFQNNSIQISHLRLLNNIPSSVSSSESNLLSFSINNNHFNDFSCSFESITKKQPRFLQKNQNIFDGLGLSLINENQQSQMKRDQSQVSEYHPQNIGDFNQ